MFMPSGQTTANEPREMLELMREDLEDADLVEIDVGE
jgi:hypothetical protein